MKIHNSMGPNPKVVRMFAAEIGLNIPMQEVDLMAVRTDVLLTARASTKRARFLRWNWMMAASFVKSRRSVSILMKLATHHH